VNGATARLADIAGGGDGPTDPYGRAAFGLAALRSMLGVAALVMPERAGRAWIGEGASGRNRAVLLRALGGRDVALGVGALMATEREGELARWLAVGALSDLVDALATAAGFGALPRFRRWMVIAASAGAAVVGFGLAQNFSARAPATPRPPG
jgi:hypothetical protein